MVQFIQSTSGAGIRDDMQGWGQLYGEADARAHARWQQEEARRRYDEQNRYNRDEAMSSSEFMNANAGQFADDGTLAGLRPQNVPAAAASNAGIAQGGGPAATPGTQLGAPATNPKYAVPVVDVGADTVAANSEAPLLEPSTYQVRNASQATANRTYVQSVRNFRGGRHGPEPLRRSLGALVSTRVITQAQANAEYGRILRAMGQSRRHTIDATDNAQIQVSDRVLGDTAGSPEAGVDGAGAPVAAVATQTGGTALPAAEAGLTGLEEADPPQDGYYNGTNDTSRGLQPTREMQLLRTNINDSLRRANVASSHGQNEVAQAAFAQALQGQAALLQQEHMVLYRAASGGSLDAMSALLEQFHGYPPGTVQIQPTDERRTRFNLQIQNDAGRWITASEVPRTRNEILGGLLDMVDASGAAARTEANTEWRRAQLTAGVQLTIANTEQRTALLRMLNDRALAQMNNEARQQLEAGRGQIEFNEEAGYALFHYSTRDAEGNVEPGLELLRLEDQAGPSTNGRGETTQVLTRTRVTGQPNVRPNQ